MRKFTTFGLFLIMVGLIVMRQEEIITFINSYVLPNRFDTEITDPNEYYRNIDFEYVQIADSFSPNKINDIINIYYTMINAGKSSFTFYCPSSYEGCLDDVQTIANDQALLSDINNYIHPYNGFSHIETQFDSLGRVTISVVRSYREEDIRLINEKVDVLYNQLVNPNLTAEDNIKTIHDYIINHTKYDSLRADQQILNYKSDTAYGPLFEGYGLCGGYTDLMALFLEKLDIKNFKVSSENHVWNALYLDGRWYHLDLTWDDPISLDGRDYLGYDYFLITTQELLDKEKSQHNFNLERYPELK